MKFSSLVMILIISSASCAHAMNSNTAIENSIVALSPKDKPHIIELFDYQNPTNPQLLHTLEIPATESYDFQGLNRETGDLEIRPLAYNVISTHIAPNTKLLAAVYHSEYAWSNYNILSFFTINSDGTLTKLPDNLQQYYAQKNSYSAAFTHDSQLLYLTPNGFIDIIRIPKDNKPQSNILALIHSQYVTGKKSMTISPDNQYIFIATSNESKSDRNTTITVIRRNNNNHTLSNVIRLPILYNDMGTLIPGIIDAQQLICTPKNLIILGKLIDTCYRLMALPINHDAPNIDYKYPITIQDFKENPGILFLVNKYIICKKDGEPDALFDIEELP